MKENYHSGNIMFSLFDFRGPKDELKCKELIAEQFELFSDNDY